MIVGIGDITPRNYVKFYARLEMANLLNGMVIRDGKNYTITLDDVRRHIGLHTNVAYERDHAWVMRRYWQNVRTAASKYQRGDQETFLLDSPEEVIKDHFENQYGGVPDLKLIHLRRGSNAENLEYFVAENDRDSSVKGFLLYAEHDGDYYLWIARVVDGGINQYRPATEAEETACKKRFPYRLYSSEL